MTICVPCPGCGRPVPWSEEAYHRPFCSRRCKLIDLGAWIEEERRIPDSQDDSHRTKS